ncbi:hypothetical protein [Streptomyces sp. NBC_00038]|uniref:hypothetical protein n=1 Tax=Streptomyces sp. NBC_00038 TaxID=2903615 RepID=UPI002256EB7A|nr:hypothetical protein [Streptomyces sp. NBC_00038]MCX5557283.1 hypothetical protein [Streptomyces sp. NBC_00038]
MLLLVAGLAAAAVRFANRKRASRRNEDLRERGSVKIPCRLSWPDEIKKKGFTYGKILTGSGGGVTFSGRGGKSVILPPSEWIHRDSSWRTGLLVLRYGVPGKGELRILIGEADAPAVEKLLTKQN